MQLLTIQQAADYLEVASVESSTDHGFAVTHTGRNAAGVRFVMVNDASGDTTLTEQP